MENETHEKPTLGSLFSGIGGIDLGFERAGWRTVWQVEINPVNRTVLADGFPRATRFEDVRACGLKNLSRVDCIAGGFPCQDISTSGASRRDKAREGLRGARSGLFYEAARIIGELRPEWVVLENVAALLHSNDCEDIQIVISTLAKLGYLGCLRVLDAQHFGSPCRRRRVFVVGRLGRPPPLDIISDAAPVEPVCSTLPPGDFFRSAAGWPGYTLQAANTPGRISLGCELLVAHPDGWNQMVERGRASAHHGLSLGLDAASLAEAYGAGNAVHVEVARWLANKIHPANADKGAVIPFPSQSRLKAA